MPKEIDNQFPFIQVAQDVGAKAAMLAPLLGVTYQHVRGSLDVFWESLADRRYLARVDTVVLDMNEAEHRLALAFGVNVAPEMLVYAGFLEKLPDGRFRVRGMSRYIKAEKRRPLHGKRTPTPPEVESKSSSTPLPLESKSTEVRGERLEVRDKRGEGNTAPSFFGQPPPREPNPPASQKTTRTTTEYTSLQEQMDRVWLRYRAGPYTWRHQDETALRGVLRLANGSESQILERWEAALRHEGYPRCGSVQDLERKWTDYVPKRETQKGDRARV